MISTYRALGDTIGAMMTINKRKERQKGVKDNDEEGSCTTMRESFWLHGQGCSGQAQWPLMGPLHDEKHTNT